MNGSKTRGKKRKAFLAAATAFVTTLCVLTTSSVSAGMYAGSKFYASYNSMKEAKVAAEQLTKELVGEGAILMKNIKNTLPLRGDERVSVFGVTSDNLVGCADSSSIVTGLVDKTVADALEREGFKVNPTLKQFYANNSDGEGNEVTDFGGVIKESFAAYDDVAVVVFSRDGGEGSDVKRVTSETVGEGDTHRALYSETVSAGSGEGTGEGSKGEVANSGKKTYKHALMLTDSEEKLIELVTANFKKVVVVLNTSNVMEIGSLAKNDKISAIIDIGRPGMGGLNALAEILSGKINPSGCLVDEWMTDLTTDPTWYNFGDNSQTKGYMNGVGDTTYLYADGTKTGAEGSTTAYDSQGYHGVDYEENIYLGYKYYETYYYDKYSTNAAEATKWWNDNVTYPFGYGLSYTTFSFKAGKLYTDASCTKELGTSVSADKFASSVGKPAQIEKLYIPVTVKNTGSVAGKKTVQVYVTAPYTKGGIEKSAVQLVGFAKTDILDPGKSQTVIVEFNVQDMASWDYNDANKDGNKGDYELDKGEYVIRVMENSHFNRATNINDTADAYDEVRFTLTGTVNQKIDDFSHLELKNLFSAENGTYGADTKDHDLAYNNIRTGEYMADGTTGMTLLSRADMDGTFPKAPTAADVTFKDNILSNWAYWDNYRVTDNVEIGNDGLPTTTKTWDASYDKETDPWYKSASDIPTSWTQAKGTYDENHLVQNNRTELKFGMYVSSAAESPIKFADMSGVAYDDPKWDEFLNQLTYDELCTVVEFGGYSTVDIASVGKLKSQDTDGPNILDGTHRWCSEDIIASTFNVELANKEGKLMGDLGLLHGVQGWYAPGADMHRSPFSGRNNEYYSQDAFHSGTMAAAVISGVQSKGVVCYVKHCFMNDQETDRGNLFTWASEQCIRETYAKAFQIALQEGDCKAAMTGYGRLAGFSNTGNYNLSTELYQKQWGTQAYFVTDGYIGWVNRTDPDIMVRTGNQMELYTTPYVEYLSGEWNADKKTVMVGPNLDIESPTQWYCVRMAAKGILYQLSTTAAQFNGYSEINIAGGDLEAATQGLKYEASIALDGQLTPGSTATYSVNGMLPEGLSVDTTTGKISGTPTAEGNATLNVTYLIDGYVEKTAVYNLTVKAAFAMDKNGDALDSAKVGKEFMARITSEEFTTEKYTSVKYEIAEGKLPAGVELKEDGTIQGTPTEAGTFNVTAKMTAESESSGGGKGKGGESNNNTTLNYAFTMVVASDDPNAPTQAPEKTDWKENVPYIGANGHWYVNGEDLGVNAKAEVVEKTVETKTGNVGGIIVGICGTVLGIAAILGAVLIVRKKK